MKHFLKIEYTHVLYALENVYSVVCSVIVGGSELFMSTMAIMLTTMFIFPAYLLIFTNLHVLPVIGRGLLKSLTVILDLSFLM